jgi:transposase
MPIRYAQDIKAKAIRLVREHAGDYPSEYAAITAVARRLGVLVENSAVLLTWAFMLPAGIR